MEMDGQAQWIRGGNSIKLKWVYTITNIHIWAHHERLVLIAYAHIVILSSLLSNYQMEYCSFHKVCMYVKRWETWARPCLFVWTFHDPISGENDYRMSFLITMSN